VILEFGGRDATAAYTPIHPSDALDKNIAPEKHLGDLDQASILELRQEKENQTKTRDELRVEEALKNRPPLSRMINVQDMEVEKNSHQTLALFDAGIPHRKRPRNFFLIKPWLTMRQPQMTP
jgi:hypothetical protein